MDRFAPSPLSRSHSLPLESADDSSLSRIPRFTRSSIPGMPPDFKRVEMQRIRTNAVVQIMNSASARNLNSPWSTNNAEYTGSGFIIAGRIVVTNAHVVDDTKVLSFRKQSDGRRFQARVLAVANDVDLAFCTVDEELFWSNALELSITEETVHFQDEVHVIGYPIGGETVCVTEGVVSRIDWGPYSHSKRSNLCIQVDAAINSGNSGGPCLFEGKVCGVAFQGIGRSDADNVGYIIPASILLKVIGELRRMISASVDSLPSNIKIPEFGMFRARFQLLENPSLRAFSKVPENVTGVLVNFVSEFSWLHEIVREGDILTSFDGNTIGFDGNIAFAAMDGGRIDFRVCVTSKLVGESIDVEYCRNGKLSKKTLVVESTFLKLPEEQLSGCYCMFAGVVFVPKSVNLVWHNNKRFNWTGLLYTGYREQTVADEQSIVVTTVLPHVINQHYSEDIPVLTELLSVNGTIIYNMRGLVKAIEDAKKKDADEGGDEVQWITFKLANDKLIAFPLREAIAATDDIMKDNSIIREWDKIDMSESFDGQQKKEEQRFDDGIELVQWKEDIAPESANDASIPVIAESSQIDEVPASDFLN